MLSDPVENATEALAAVLAQSQPFDEGQFPSRDQISSKSHAFLKGQSLAEG